jgi:hypothetical protein
MAEDRVELMEEVPAMHCDGEKTSAPAAAGRQELDMIAEACKSFMLPLLG